MKLNELVNGLVTSEQGLVSDIISVLIDHFSYSIKDINSYEELTDQEKQLCSKEMFLLMTHEFQDLVVIPIKCKRCNTTHYVPVDKKDLESYLDGALTQRSFPYLPESYRELLISRLCSKCFDDIMSESETFED